MRMNKKKRGCDPRRSRDTSSFGRLRSQTVLSSLNMVRGMATCRGRWILPREGGWSHGLGLWAVATRLTLFVFFPKYHQMCGSCQGQRSRAPFGKMRKNKTTKEQLFFSSSTSSFRQCQKACMCVTPAACSRSQFPLV